MSDSLIRPVDVERVFFDTFNNHGDDALADFIQSTRSIGSDHRRAIKSALEDIAYFIEDSPNKFLRAQASRTIRRLIGADLKDKITASYGEDLTGLELSSNDGLLGVVFLPDASNVGCFRVVYYCEMGFLGHSTRTSYELLLDECIKEGYRTLVTGMLDKLSQLESFRSGNEDVAKIQAGLL